MSAIRLIGRKPKTGAPRINPEVRFRQRQYLEKSAGQSANTKRPFKRNRFSAPLTKTGFIFAFLGLLGGIFFIWFFIFSTRFLVTNVEISQATSLTREDIKNIFHLLQNNKRFFVIPGNHIAILSEKSLSQTAGALYPQVHQVTGLSRIWPNKVSFAVEEKKPLYIIYSSSGHRYLLDEEGIVLGEVGEIMPADLITVDYNLKQSPELGKKLPEADFLGLVSELTRLWPEELGFNLSRFEIRSSHAEGEFALHTNENWVIKTDGNDEAARVITALKLIFQNEIKSAAQRQLLAYVDVRLSDRVFYCLKGQPCESSGL